MQLFFNSVCGEQHSEDYRSGWQLLTKRLGDRVQLVGDDIFVTQSSFLRKVIEDNFANTILINPNQVGILTDMFETFFGREVWLWYDNFTYFWRNQIQFYC
ncbi:hypothetical protein [Candidatus Ichthyocystis sparus]|uniref:hypothetical protein n=1 Tax=Candidatus Ichthyocystis sparus TaxID=1561004 RepID=UPI000AB5B270|nr:hypothetical protein [Candidatus Ichthyocystis sparus]